MIFISLFISGSIQNVVRAVARKSTSKASKPSNLSSTVRAEDTVLISEHKGRFKTRPNDSYHHADFEPHQCTKECVKSFSYADGDYKSESFFLMTNSLTRVSSIQQQVAFMVILFSLIRFESFVYPDALRLVSRNRKAATRGTSNHRLSRSLWTADAKHGGSSSLPSNHWFQTWRRSLLL